MLIILLSEHRVLQWLGNSCSPYINLFAAVDTYCRQCLLQGTLTKFWMVDFVTQCFPMRLNMDSMNKLTMSSNWSGHVNIWPVIDGDKVWQHLNFPGIDMDSFYQYYKCSTSFYLNTECFNDLATAAPLILTCLLQLMLIAVDVYYKEPWQKFEWPIFLLKDRSHKFFCVNWCSDAMTQWHSDAVTHWRSDAVTHEAWLVGLLQTLTHYRLG